MNETLLSIFLPIILGYILLKIKYIPERVNKDLKLFVVRVAVPFRIFTAMYNTSMETIKEILPLSLSFVLLTAILIIFSFLLLFKIKDSKIKASYMLGIVYGNYGWIGWAVLNGAYGTEGLSRGVFFTSLWWPILYLGSFAIAKITKVDSELDVKNYVLNMVVPIASLIIGLTFNILQIPIYPTFEKTINGFSDMTLPIILFTVGLSISVRNSFKDIKRSILPVVLRPVLGIIGGLLTIFIIGFKDPLSINTVLMESTMPVAVFTVVLGDMLGLDEKLLSSILILSTLFSLITVPLVLYFL
ncbi:MAG: AEC family transporter [Spirochaetales bacterium]|nr:AEC family transporter [Spirochaetales bacterium]